MDAIHRDLSLRRISEQITANGFAVIEDYVKEPDLRRAQAFVVDAVKANAGEYVNFAGTDDLADTFLAELPTDPSFTALCRGLYETVISGDAPEVEFYQILRCLSGKSAKRHSMRFHFDSYVLTALLPIIIPGSGSAGRLIIHPNTRDIRKTYLANLFDKIVSDNQLTQALLNRAYRRHSQRLVRLSLKPGNLYFFWGYRSLHTNEPCDQDSIRATALLHYADPHANSRLKKLLRR